MSKITMTRHAKSSLRIVVGIAITIAFVWLVAQRVDLAHMKHAFLHLRFGYVGLGVVMLVLGYSVRIWRWHRMLQALGASVRYLDSARAFLAGTAINNVVPLRAGDAMRVIGLHRETGFAMTRILSSLVVERLLDISVLLLLLFTAIIWLPPNTLPAWVVTAAKWVLAIVVILETCVLAGPRPVIRLMERSVTPLAPRLGTLIHNTAAGFADLAQPRLVIELFFYSLVSWLFEGLLFVAFVKAAGTAANAFFAGFSSFALGTLSTMIPSGPGYIGTFDVFTMTALQVFGIEANVAAVIAVGIHAALWITTTLAGAVFIIFGGFAWRREIDRN